MTARGKKQSVWCVVFLFFFLTSHVVGKVTFGRPEEAPKREGGSEAKRKKGGSSHLSIYTMQCVINKSEDMNPTSWSVRD